MDRFSAGCLPGRSSSRPPLLRRSPHHQTHRQQGKRRRQMQGQGQRPKHEPRRQQQPRASAERPVQPPPTQIPSSNALQRSAHPCRRPTGMFPDVGRELLGEGAFDTKRAQVRTLPPRPKPKHPGYGAQHRVGQCERTTERGAARQRVIAQRAAARGASEHGRRSKRRREKQGVGSTRRSSSCPHEAERRPATRGLPATRARRASLSSTSRPWTRHSASGL